MRWATDDAERDDTVVRKLPTGTFEIFESGPGAEEWVEITEQGERASDQQRFYFRLKASNGEIVLASSQGYTSQSGAENGVRSVRANAAVEDSDAVDDARQSWVDPWVL